MKVKLAILGMLATALAFAVLEIALGHDAAMAPDTVVLVESREEPVTLDRGPWGPRLEPH